MAVFARNSQRGPVRITGDLLLRSRTRPLRVKLKGNKKYADPK